MKARKFSWAGALLLWFAGPVVAQIANVAVATRPGESTARLIDTGGDTWRQRSSQLTHTATDTTILSRYALVVAADGDNFVSPVSEVHATDYSIDFSVQAPAGTNFELSLQTERRGDFNLARDDGSVFAITLGTLGAVAASISGGGVLAGSLNLPEEALMGVDGQAFAQSNGATIRGIATGSPLSYALGFTWESECRSESAAMPMGGWAGGLECALRLGLPVTAPSRQYVGAYPGDPARTQGDDGHFVEVTLAYCGDGIQQSDLGEQCDEGAANGGNSCCTSTCQMRSAGATCRAAASGCDLAELCDGSSPACPADVGACPALGIANVSASTFPDHSPDDLFVTSGQWRESSSSLTASGGGANLQSRYALVAASDSDQGNGSMVQLHDTHYGIDFTFTAPAGTDYELAITSERRGVFETFGDDGLGAASMGFPELSSVIYEQSGGVVTSGTLNVLGASDDDFTPFSQSASTVIRGSGNGLAKPHSVDFSWVTHCLSESVLIGGFFFSGGPECAVKMGRSLTVAGATVGQYAGPPSDDPLDDGHFVNVVATWCGDGVTQAGLGEQCDAGADNGGTSCCTEQCQLRSPGYVCRVSAGGCDVAETCDGSVGACPPDVAACTPTPTRTDTPQPTATAQATNTSVPTNTPVASNTPVPTDTPPPSPSTPTPTATATHTDAPPNTSTPTPTLVPACGNGVVDRVDGLEEACDDGNLDDGDGCESDCRYTPVNEAVDAGGTVSTDVAGTGTSPQIPLHIALTSPVAGTIVVQSAAADGLSADIEVLGTAFDIEAPAASPTDPLVLVFSLDASALPPGAEIATLEVLRNGVAVADCTGGPSLASPDPCVLERIAMGDGVQITVLTSRASSWAVVARGLDDVARKCVNQLNGKGLKVWAAQAKLALACVKAAANGKESAPEACLTADAAGKVGAAQGKTLAADQGSCGAPPRFAYVGGAAVNSVARGTAIDLVHDLLGPDIDASVQRMSINPAAAQCQSAVLKAASGAVGSQAKLFLRCKKEGLAGKGNLMTSAAELEECFDALRIDAKGTVAKGHVKLDATIRKACDAVDAAAAFPGSCAGSSLTPCIDQRVACNVCRLFNGMDGLDEDCDVFDDATTNGSCP